MLAVAAAREMHCSKMILSHCSSLRENSWRGCNIARSKNQKSGYKRSYLTPKVWCCCCCYYQGRCCCVALVFTAEFSAFATLNYQAAWDLRCKSKIYNRDLEFVLFKYIIVIFLCYFIAKYRYWAWASVQIARVKVKWEKKKLKYKKSVDGWEESLSV